MKKLLSKIDRFRTIARVMDNNAAAFEGFPEIIVTRDKYFSYMTRINELYSELTVPVKDVYGNKRNSENQLRAALKQAIGTGITVALRQNNIPLLESLRSYKSNVFVTNQHELPEVATRVYNELASSGETASNLGLTTQKLTELQELISAYRELMEVTDLNMSTRKSSRNTLITYVSECQDMLRDEIDTFVGHRKETFPDFYVAYFTARGIKRRRRRKTGTKTELYEITGTVTDNSTGLPLANAVINLLTPETIVMTDEDGVYVLEDLVAGEYTVSCHLAGYEVPANLTVTATNGKSPVADFNLVPVQQQAAA